MFKINEIAFSCYPVKDMARARKFYESVLGLKPTLTIDEPGECSGRNMTSPPAHWRWVAARRIGRPARTAAPSVWKSKTLMKPLPICVQTT